MKLLKKKLKRSQFTFAKYDDDINVQSSAHNQTLHYSTFKDAVGAPVVASPGFNSERCGKGAGGRAVASTGQRKHLVQPQLHCAALQMHIANAKYTEKALVRYFFRG